MDILVKLRKEKNKTQKEVAEYLQTSQQTYGRYENGTREADYETLCKLADYFGVSVDYLLGREMEENASPLLHIPEEYKNLPIAFYEGAKDLTQEDIDDVVKFMEFLKKKKSDK